MSCAYHRLLDMSFICRLSLMWQAGITAALMHLTPDSLTAEMVARAGNLGEIVSFCFAGFVLIALLDLIVNDLLPDRFVLRWAARYRFLGVAGIGIVYLFLASTIAVDDVVHGEWVLILAYTGLAGFCMWWSTACVYADYRKSVAGAERRRKVRPC